MFFCCTTGKNPYTHKCEAQNTPREERQKIMFAALKKLWQYDVKAEQARNIKMQESLDECFAMMAEIKASRQATDIAIGKMRADSGRYINALVRDSKDAR